jgi:glycosyltransferase involved in cell wall biosynthesis
MKHPSYVVVTPARNEVEFIEATIRSVVAQSVLPLKWVIVSDGSTDGTDEIVARYAATHAWIELVSVPERKERHFAGKVMAVRAGMERIRDVPYEVIASLDADITFDPEYFAFLLEKMASDETLGVVGTPYIDDSTDPHDYRITNIEDVAGACQVFRRECFEAIGGYVPLKGGSIDTVAVLTARMKGWKTRTFLEKSSLHHRKWGTAQCGPIRAIFNNGIRDYSQGNHPVWELFRSLYQMTRKPKIVRGVALEAGYLWAWMRRAERPVSAEFIAFRQREQMQRLGTVFSRKANRSIADS